MPATTEKKPKTKGSPAHVVFKHEIVQAVYGPLISTIIRDNPNMSVAGLTEKFNKAHNCATSPGTMREWLDLMGLTPTTTVTYQHQGAQGDKIPI